MNNAEKFKQIFGLYATELWSMPEGDFLAWLNRDVETTQIDHDADTGKKVCVDTISRQAALDAIIGQPPEPHYPSWYAAQIEKLPAAQPEPTKMIKEIRKWINSRNRGSADYFIVDKIEEIIDKYE